MPCQDQIKDTDEMLNRNEPTLEGTFPKNSGLLSQNLDLIEIPEKLEQQSKSEDSPFKKTSLNSQLVYSSTFDEIHQNPEENS